MTEQKGIHLQKDTEIANTITIDSCRNFKTEDFRPAYRVCTDSK